MRSDKLCNPTVKFTHIAPRLVQPGLILCAFALALSGCVGSSLNQNPGLSTAALSLDSNAKTTDTTSADGTAPTPAQAGMAEGITVPSAKPGSETPQPQLALASPTAASPAAQQATSVATAEPKPTPKAHPQAKPEIVVAKAKAPEKKSFFASLFAPSKKPASSRNVIKPRSKKGSTSKTRKVAVFKSDGNSSLPGVRKRLFGIYDAKEGADEGYGRPVLMASAGGMARTSPNGLRIQHAGVQVACLKPGLVNIIKKVQRRYGRVPVITSGYRSPRRNRKARGVRNSMHLYCKAADIQVAGVSKWALAKYLRSIPGRGGVGTYCHTKSVHIDIGTKRDWNWRCRRSKRKR